MLRVSSVRYPFLQLFCLFQIPLTPAGSPEAASLLPSSIIRLAAPLRTCTVTLLSLSLLPGRHYIHVRSSPCPRPLICQVRNDGVLIAYIWMHGENYSWYSRPSLLTSSPLMCERDQSMANAAHKFSPHQGSL